MEIKGVWTGALTDFTVFILHVYGSLWRW